MPNDNPTDNNGYRGSRNSSDYKNLSYDIRRFSIGAELRVLRDRLLDAGEKLINVMEGSEAVFVDDLLSSLEASVCRVAVIGQVNVGKSSFVNALVRRTNLLPTGMDPCTAVLTKLNFTPGRFDNGTVRFTFFRPEEWTSLTSRHDGAEDDLQDLNSEDAHPLAQLEKMGKAPVRSRMFRSASKDVMNSYIAEARPAEGDAQDDPAKNPSHMTKSADLFFELDPYCYPASIIDTPGVDHPKRHRRHITWENINDADIYLLMVNADAGLSRAEISLLRSLHMLRQDRIIVLVNQIDKLEGGLDVYRSAVKNIESQIHEEIPGLDAPIIPTSALWGSGSHEVSELDPSLLANPMLHEIASEVSDEYAAALNDHPDSTENNTEKVEQALYYCSGLPNVLEEMNRLMKRSDCFKITYDTAATLVRLSDLNVALRTIELEKLAEIREHRSVLDPPARGEDHRAEKCLDGFRNEIQSMKQVVKRFEDETQSLINEALSELHKKLEEALSFYILGIPENNRHSDDFEVVDDLFNETSNAIHLKGYISMNIIDEYHRIKKKLFSNSLSALGDLHQVIKGCLKTHGKDIADPLPLYQQRMPTFVPVSQVIESELDKFLEGADGYRGDPPVTVESARAFVSQTFPHVVEKFLETVKLDLENTLAKEKRLLDIHTELTQTRLHYIHGRLAARLSGGESEEDGRARSNLDSEIDVNAARAADLLRSGQHVLGQMKDIYYFTINSRNLFKSA